MGNEHRAVERRRRGGTGTGDNPSACRSAATFAVDGAAAELPLRGSDPSVGQLRRRHGFGGQRPLVEDEQIRSGSTV